MTILFFLQKNYIKLIFIFILLIVLAYTTNIEYIPNSLILFQNEELNIKSLWGINLEETLERLIKTVMLLLKIKTEYHLKFLILCAKYYNLNLINY